MKAMRTYGDSKISLCNFRVEKHLMKPPTSGMVQFSVCEVFVDD